MAIRAADISVIIPSLERTSLAMETVRSVLGQSRQVREIIVVANGNDEHAAFWQAQAGGIIKVVREAVPGQQAARTAGLQVATSTWVALLDDDDIYAPNFIESVVPAIEDGRADIISTDHRKFWPDRVDEKTNNEAAPSGYWKGIRPRRSATEWSFVGKFPLHLLLKRIPIYPSTMVIRRAFAIEIGGFDSRIYGIRSEDIEFLIRALTYGKLSLVWRPLVYYRVHAGNLTRDRSTREIGRWRIFEFARANHPHLPENFRKALDRDLPRRRLEVARLAREVGDTELFQEVWSILHPVYRTPAAQLLLTMLKRVARSSKMAKLLRILRLGTRWPAKSITSSEWQSEYQESGVAAASDATEPTGAEGGGDRA
jgi:glycosyltransferase involved in cell wall biosynthesis